MKCPSCATELPDDARFCGGCGHRFSSAASSSSTAEAPAAVSGRIPTPPRDLPQRFDLVPEDFARALERACAKAQLPLPPGMSPVDHASLFQAAEAAGITKVDVEKALHLVSLEKLPASARKAMGVVLEDDVPAQGRSLWLPLVVAINAVALLVGVGAYLLYDPTPERAPIELRPQRGEIDVVALNAALDRLSETAQGCYREALKQDRKLSGNLVLTLRIGLDGKAESPRVSKDELGHEGAARCIVDAAAQATYPAATGAPVEVDVPLSFAAKPG